MTEEEERERGVLSSADRRYLRKGGDDLSEGSEYNTKRRIRRRVENSLLDFTILFEELEEEEREKIFHTDDGAYKVFEDDDFGDGVRDALAFILHNHGIVEFMRVGDTGYHIPAEQLLESAYERVGRKEEYLVEDVARPEIEAVHLRNVLRDLERGEDIPPLALGKVIETGKLDDQTVDEIQEMVRSELVDEK